MESLLKPLTKPLGRQLGKPWGNPQAQGQTKPRGKPRGTETKRAAEREAERLEAYSRLQDTIFALASGGANGTAESGSAIAVVRISGTNAEAALEALCPIDPCLWHGKLVCAVSMTRRGVC